MTQDAELAYKAGVDGIVVSNHGKYFFETTFFSYSLATICGR